VYNTHTNRKVTAANSPLTHTHVEIGRASATNSPRLQLCKCWQQQKKKKNKRNFSIELHNKNCCSPKRYTKQTQKQQQQPNQGGKQ